jgi:hypothetical protein
MSACDCYPCNNRIRHLEGQVQDLETQLEQLRRDLEHEVDARRDAIRMLASDIRDMDMARLDP